MRATKTYHSFEEKRATQWLATHESIARTYQLPQEEVQTGRAALLLSIFTLLSRNESILERDVEFAAETAQKYGQLQCYPAQLRELLLQVFKTWAIQRFENGQPPTTPCHSLMLGKNEVCHWEEPARLLEEHKRRVYVGGYLGVSVRLSRNIRLRPGGFAGTPIETNYYADRGHGIFHITSQRICFTGDQQSIEIPYRKILNLAGFPNGFMVHSSKSKKPTILLVAQPELTAQLVNLASPSTDGQ